MEQPSASGSIKAENMATAEDKLVDLWNQGLLTAESFQNVWKVSALNNYKIESGQDGIPKILVDEVGVHQHIFEALEQFIYRRDKAASLKELEKIENPTVLCGHVFNCGESTYTCRDCALDPTCVFCVDCFNHSAHRNHRYKMSTSSGGGSCDCGDVEAWKTEAWCSIHKTDNMASINQQDSDDINTYEILDSLDQDIVNRIKIVFKAAIIYASEILMHCNYHHVPGGLTPHTTRCPDLLDTNLSSSPTYCTILYNDELHDYDQVTSALEGAMMCSQKTATDLMTNADRKGRTLVASGDFKTCRQVYTEIKRISMLPGNRPLKLSILHSSVIANQYFALDMLVWLEKMVKSSKAMRLIFSQFTMQDSLDCALLKLMNNTSRMWKESRSLWIRLFFNGALLEYGTKKIFAKFLSIHYDALLDDFLKDDQDHTFSILSLSVQVYTVPSLALYLMEQHNVLYQLINAFFNQCLRMDNSDRFLSSNMKLKLGHHQDAKKLQRIYFVLSDICYILSVKPNEWNDNSRSRFILGVSMLIKLLGLMHGMEPFTRCLRGHVEYEQKWEYSFFLQCRMAFVLNSVQDWCGSDKVVLIETYKNLLNAIAHNPLAGMVDGVLVKCAVGKHSVECLHYDVSRKEISVHIPVTRLFSDIYLHLQRYGLHFNSPELHISSKPTIEQILEPVLRIQVLIAQVHANMWRRNGLGLPIQLQSWYASRKCRQEMLDSDIALLQTAATIMDSKDFIITMLNRFDLLKWAEAQYCQVQVPGADKLQEVIVLAEEFLRLLIVIVGERYKPGVGQVTAEECLCHEIVQQLCVKTMSHSELNRTLPKDFHLETGLDDVVDLVASLKEQSQGKREYELKPERAKEFNVFSYHYNREDRSIAEENHLKRKKLAKELECCPPPIPPPFSPAYHSVLNILQCDVVFIVMKNVIERALMKDFKCFSELQLQETLYLIGYGLIEEERQVETAKSTNSSCTNLDLKFSSKAEEMKILPNMLEELLKNPRTETKGQSSLVTWVLFKYRQVSKLRNSPTEMRVEETFENPVAGTSHDEDEAKRKAKLTRSELIAKQRLQTLQQMQALQENFMKNHASYLAVVDAEMQEEENVSMQSEVEGINLESPVAVGPNRTTAAPVERRFTCLLCQATEVIGAPESRPMVMTGLVQQSTVLCRRREKVKRSLEDDRSMSCISKDFPCLPNNLGPAPYVSSCGHKLHTECFYTYHAKSVEAESQRLLRDLPPLFDVDKGELLCPLCKNLSNVVLPVLQPMDTFMTNSEKELIDFNLDDWLSSLKIFLDPKIKEQLDLETKQKHSSLLAAQKQPILITELTDSFSQLTETIYKAATSQGLQSYVEHHPTYLWQTCAYTIHSLECVQRESGKALLGQFTSRQEETLRALILSSAVDPAFLKSNALRNITFDLLKLVMLPEDTDSCIIEWDMFGLLVSLTLALPSLFASEEHMFYLPACATKELHTLHLVLLANIVNLLLGMAVEQTDVPMEVDAANSEMMEESMDGQEALNLLKIVCEAAKIPAPSYEFTPSQLWKRLTQDCVPFLRCCAIFFRFLSGVPASPALSEPGGDTFTNLCAFLGLPTTCKDLLGHQTANEMARRWCSHKNIKMLLNEKTVTLGPVKLNKLVPLVTDYKDQLNLVNAFRCSLTNVESHNPTMCLVCGEIVCAKSFCCQKKIKGRLLGPAMIHSYQCGAGIGLFLSIRDCEILVLYSPDQGCFLTPPYVDKYGETDQGLDRGNPLYLCTKTYRDLYTQWLSHSLIQTICHKYDDSSHRHYLWHKF